MPRSSSSARRVIRAKASGVSSRLPHLYAPPPKPPKNVRFSLSIPVWIETYEVHGTHPRKRLARFARSIDAMEWGRAWAKERLAKGLNPRWEVVGSSPSLVSEASELVDEETGETDPAYFGQPDPSTDEEIEAVIKRVREILAELACRAPYGKCVEFQIGFPWVEWTGEEDFEPYPYQEKYWGSQMRERPILALLDVETAVKEVLKNGKDASNLWKYLHPGSATVSWLTIPSIDISWKCAEDTGKPRCAPEAQREENAEVVALVGSKKKAKRVRRKAAKRAKKKASRARNKKVRSKKAAKRAPKRKSRGKRKR